MNKNESPEKGWTKIKIKEPHSKLLESRYTKHKETSLSNVYFSYRGKPVYTFQNVETDRNITQKNKIINKRKLDTAHKFLYSIMS